ncbi:MAG: hypothetical protein ACFFCP_20015 [Promethearchaeota archaeon]
MKSETPKNRVMVAIDGNIIHKNKEQGTTDEQLEIRIIELGGGKAMMTSTDNSLELLNGTGGTIITK